MANKIHPTAIIEGDVELGDGNVIDAYVVLRGPMKIGNNNQIFPHVVIGTPGEDIRHPYYDASNCRIEIGDDNIIREHTTITKPCYEDLTRIGNKVYVMHGCHIPHDVILYDEVVVTATVAIGGLARILRGANLGMAAQIHQRVVVGHYSIAAMGAPVLRNIRPFSRYIPGKPISVNYYALEKFGFTDEKAAIEDYVRLGTLPDSATRAAGVIREYQEFTKRHATGEYT
jgi:UDP-N-acetylglucosamine acyltransferase